MSHFLDLTNIVLKHLRDNFSSAPIRLPNVKFEPAENAPGGWIWPNIIPVSRERETIVGSDVGGGILVEGLLSIQVFSPIGSGYGDAYTWADELMTLLREITLTLTSGKLLRFEVPETFAVGETESWFQVNVQAPFHFHT